jgi:hypothetical protein
MIRHIIKILPQEIVLTETVPPVTETAEIRIAETATIPH